MLTTMRLVVTILSLALVGCGSVTMDVTRYHDPAANLRSPNTYAFSRQPTSAEFRKFQGLLSAEFDRVGWSKVPKSDARYVASSSFQLDEGSYYSPHAPIYGSKPIDNTTPPRSSKPEFEQVGTVQEKGFVHVGELILQIEDRRSGKVVFAGRVISQGPTGRKSVMIPVMIRSVFSDFPGKNGGTQRFVESL